MNIHVNTDNHIDGSAELITHVKSVVTDTLDRYSDRISRVEVHLNDENAHKNVGNDIRCMMEARLEGYPPVAVTERASNIHQAIDGAAEKLLAKLGSDIERRRNY